MKNLSSISKLPVFVQEGYPVYLGGAGITYLPPLTLESKPNFLTRKELRQIKKNVRNKFKVS